MEQETALLDEMLAEAALGGVVVVPPLKLLLEQKLGNSLSLTAIYSMLHRHGWRKLAPDTAHPQGNPQAREDWEKLCADLVQITASFGEKNPIRVMFQDEVRFGRISHCRRCWHKKPMRPGSRPCSRMNTPMPMARSILSMASSIRWFCRKSTVSTR